MKIAALTSYILSKCKVYMKLFKFSIRVVNNMLFQAYLAKCHLKTLCDNYPSYIKRESPV